jgi:integrase
VTGVHIRTRELLSGEKRYDVRYRRGGRGFGLEHGGTFSKAKLARARRDLIAGALAVGRDPRELIRQSETRPHRTGREWAVAYEASRVDYAPETKKNLTAHLRRINASFGERDLANVTWGDVQEWVAANADLAPASLSRYMATLRQLLDFAGVDPNPARDKRVKLPPIVKEEPQPPTAKQFLAILGAAPQRWRLPLVVLEQTGARVGEASSLVWGDVDVAGQQFRLRSAETKTRRARWVQVPGWLMERVEETCPLEDRTVERRVFHGFTPDVAKNVMARACLAAGMPHFHPHDLRHRRTSLWHGQGVPAKELAERIGHSRASLTLDIYSHVMPLDEVPRASLEAALVRHR